MNENRFNRSLRHATDRCVGSAGADLDELIADGIEMDRPVRPPVWGPASDNNPTGKGAEALAAQLAEHHARR